ncbi:MAG TPA: N-acetyltransferase [Spirochaetota bacterium]|nr:N-acetyltransferase [Spirochaetota bacterium]HOL57793.1 N-acetyltransferase [Spirochaetota bacterium]HPP05010.1 N-acetyltransferase [Spirochaetota bacterium]
MLIREANVDDVDAILNLVNGYAAQGLMLSKTPYKIYSTIQHFFVVEIDSKVVGCASLNVLWKDIAEICSLAVDNNYKGMGIGSMLVKKCIEKAKKLKVERVIALTYQDKFFEKMGFVLSNKDKFPRKLWRECLECPKLEVCDEKAYVYELI